MKASWNTELYRRIRQHLDEIRMVDTHGGHVRSQAGREEKTPVSQFPGN